MSAEQRECHPISGDHVIREEPHAEQAGFKTFSADSFCVLTASELVERFVALHGDIAIKKAQYYLDLAISSEDSCQADTWAYVISELRRGTSNR